MLLPKAHKARIILQCLQLHIPTGESFLPLPFSSAISLPNVYTQFETETDRASKASHFTNRVRRRRAGTLTVRDECGDRQPQLIPHMGLYGE